MDFLFRARFAPGGPTAFSVGPGMLMKRRSGVAIAAVGYGIWGATLYFVATTSNLVFIALGSIAAATALPATWWALRVRDTERTV